MIVWMLRIFSLVFFIVAAFYSIYYSLLLSKGIVHRQAMAIAYALLGSAAFTVFYTFFIINSDLAWYVKTITLIILPALAWTLASAILISLPHKDGNSSEGQ